MKNLPWMTKHERNFALRLKLISNFISSNQKFHSRPVTSLVKSLEKSRVLPGFNEECYSKLILPNIHKKHFNSSRVIYQKDANQTYSNFPQLYFYTTKRSKFREIRSSILKLSHIPSNTTFYTKNSKAIKPFIYLQNFIQNEPFTKSFHSTSDQNKKTRYNGLIAISVTLPKPSIDKLLEFVRTVTNMKNGSDTSASFSFYLDLKDLDLTRYLSIRIVQKFITKLKNDGAPSFRNFKKDLPFDNDLALKKSRRAIDRILQVIEDRRLYGFVPKESEYEDLIEAISQDQSKSSESEVIDLIEATLSKARNREDDYFYFTDRSFYKAIKGFVFRGHARGAFWCYNRMIREAEVLLSLSQKPGISANLKAELENASIKTRPSYFTTSIISNFLQDKNTLGPMFKIWANYVLLGERIPTSVQRSIISIFIKRNKIDEAIWISRVGRYLGLTSQSETHETEASHPSNPKEIPLSRQPIKKSWDNNIELALIIEAIGNESIYSNNDEESKADSIKYAENASNNLLQKYPPDLSVYSNLIQGCVSNGRFELAESLFYELSDFGIAPSNQTFAFMVSMYSDKEQIGKVKAIIKRLLFSERHSNSQGSNLKPKSGGSEKFIDNNMNFQFFVPLLYYFLCNNRINEAAQVIQTIRSSYDYNVSSKALGTALIQIYRALGQPKSGIFASKLLSDSLYPESETVKDIPSSDLKNIGLGIEKSIAANFEAAVNSIKPIDYKYESSYYSQKLSVYIEEKNLHLAVEVLKEMADNNILITKKIIYQLLYGFLECDSLDMFETLVNYYFEYIDNQLSPPIYTRWIQELSRRGDAKGAYGILMQMNEKGFVLSEIHYCMVIQACSLRGWTKEAVEIVDEMYHPDSPVQPGMSVKISLIEALVSAGDVDKSQSILDDLVYNSLTPRSKIPARAFNNLIIGYLYKGDGTNAMKCYESMLRLGIKPNRFTYTILMNAYAQERKIKNCSRILDQMIANNIEPDSAVFSILIAVYGVMSDIRAVENVFKQVEIQSINYINSRLRSQSVGMTRVMYPSKTTIEPYHKTLRVADGTFANKFSKIDSKLAPENMSSIKSTLVDPVILVMMIKAYIKVKNMDKALAFWGRLLESYPIIKLNPRRNDGPTNAITSDFHISAMRTIIRGFLKVIDIDQFFGKPKRVDDVSHSQSFQEESGINQQEFTDSISEQKSHVINPSGTPGADSSNLDKPADISSDGKMSSLDKNSLSQHNENAMLESLPESTEQKSIKDETQNALPDSDTNTAKRKVSSTKFDKNDETLRDFAKKLITVFNEAQKNNFCFEVGHVNDYISCMLLTSQYNVLIGTLKKCKPTQSQPIESMYKLNYYGGNANIEFPRLRINDKNVIYLIGRLKLSEQLRASTENDILTREKDLVIRHKHLMSQPKWAKSSFSNYHISISDESKSDGLDDSVDDGNLDSNSVNKAENMESEVPSLESISGMEGRVNLTKNVAVSDGNATVLPTLDDYLEKDIIMVELKRKLGLLTFDRDQLLRIIKLFSNFVSNDIVQKIADTLEID
ncbi:Pentatricopeptide repeat-containing protein [Smittium culicis]|uniref:Pentatricopeptide repeat-containing protein n=1 Tax=Smittium culicis TaxID=133412 RepID=A0A1R1YQG2_9FUNG|nr:Pentatricopeptide repeat-containing protein [Smittium culicis]